MRESIEKSTVKALAKKRDEGGERSPATQVASKRERYELHFETD